MTNQIPLEENQVQLTSQHRIQFDKMNHTLTKKYEKRDGRGRAAELSGEFAYGSPSYYGGLLPLINRLFDKEFQEGLSDSDIASLQEFKEIAEHAIAHVDQVKKEVFEHVNKHITIDLGEETKKKTKKIKGHTIEIED